MNPNRPTSPHLQIYRLPLTAVISITHRITGVGLTAGLLLILYLLYALSQGETAYLSAQWLINSWLGKTVCLAFTFALFFHLCHGIRHLFWDAGSGFSLDTLTKYAILELLSAVSLTLWAWFFV